MSVLRGLGKAGLALLTAGVIVGTYVATRDGDWWGVFVCVGTLALILALYDVLRVQDLRKQRLYGSFTLNRLVQALVLSVFGVTLGIAGVARLTSGAPLSGTIMVLGGLLLLGNGINAFRRRT